MSHTKGPWTFTEYYIHDAIGYKTKKKVSPDHWNIYGKSNDNTMKVGQALSEANARLIACAPELLQALELAKELLADKIYDPNGNHRSGAIIMISGLISKATGGAEL